METCLGASDDGGQGPGGGLQGQVVKLLNHQEARARVLHILGHACSRIAHQRNPFRPALVSGTLQTRAMT
jgi:hypothetical protein